jgi:hypothetical protein
MVRLEFFAVWSGEKNAGLLAGSETIKIEFSESDSLNKDDIEYFRETLSEYYDGANVTLEKSSFHLPKNRYTLIT